MRLGGTHECDDGNSESGDGCDESCRLEPNYLCGGGGPTSADTCVPLLTLALVSV